MRPSQELGGPELSSAPIEDRLERLEAHLQRENPVLLEVVRSFRQLDRVAYRLGLLTRGQSFTSLVPWWPLISVVGTFSSGKSTFINSLLGHKLQRTGNQAVDDKFTVICYGAETDSRTLPGLALDADPRFPFYRISHEIEQVAEGEGTRVDTYLQLKTCPSEALRGKIFIDSPGFDADEQRTSVLRITDHILDLSDLVLVMFDARHPEPGAMQDTLEHLVGKTIHRADAGKFLYILNQVDNTAREDNPEEVFAAWQRALAQRGLTAGRFYRIYDPHSAIPIEKEQVRQRFEAKRDEDMQEILARIDQVEVERAYRIVGVLDKMAHAIERDLVPRIRLAKRRWKSKTLVLEGIVFAVLAAGLLAWSLAAGMWQSPPAWLRSVLASHVLSGLGLALVAALLGYVHFSLRALAARSVMRAIADPSDPGGQAGWVVQALERNTRAWCPLLWERAIGWGPFTRRRVARIRAEADRCIQMLNDRFTNPSGPTPPPAAPGARPENPPAPEAPGDSDRAG